MAKFCPNCGKEVNENADVCLGCGVALKNNNTTAQAGKSKIAAGILGILLGSLGVHNFI